MPSRSYWQKRFEALNESLLQDSMSYYDQAEKLFRKAQSSIDKDIAGWYQRFADNNQISLQEAQKWLRANELEEFKWTLEDYIKRGKENGVSADWNKQLENASAKFHISRLQALQIQIQQHLEELYGNYLDGLDRTMRNSYEEAYYRTAYAMQEGFGADFPLAAIPKTAVDSVLSKPWASDGSNFSSRIWKDKATLLTNLENELTQGLIRGDRQDDIIRRFAKRMNTSLSSAGRLIATESAFFAAKGEYDNMKDLGVEKYQFVATLDSRTSEICRDMDMKVIPMKDFKPGVTAPPLHCWCRSCTVPYMDEMPTGFRAARDERGYTTHVEGMNYADWKAIYVDRTKTLEEWREEHTPQIAAGDSLTASGKIQIDNLHPARVANVPLGPAMTEKQADGGHVNPRYYEDRGYTINCQTCVVAYEARLRGYNVEALPNPDRAGSVFDGLSRNTRMAWIDPATGEIPQFVPHPEKGGMKTYLKWLDSTIKQGERYTIEVFWKNADWGHIIHIRKNEEGQLELYDPQDGEKYTRTYKVNRAGKKRLAADGARVPGEEDWEDLLEGYFNRVKFGYHRTKGYWQGPELLRVDDKEFNLNVVDKILKEAEE